MILVCDNCHARYLVSSAAIGPDGRRVRCKNCSHEWFQEPEAQEEEQLYGEDTIDPIPESVRPMSDESGLPALPDYEPAERSRLSLDNPVLAGAAAAAGVFLAITVLLLVFRGTIVNLWPPSAALYQTVGIAPDIAGEGLAFDAVIAEVSANEEGAGILSVRGSIINTRNVAVALPPIQVELQKQDGSIFDSWQVDPPEPRVAPQADIQFQTSYPQVPQDVKDVKIRFLLTH